MKYGDWFPFEVLKGKTLKDIKINDDYDEIIFECDDNKSYLMYQECDNCTECDGIKDINGDISDLIGNEILIAREDTEERDIGNDDFYGLWTFYNLSTIKGSLNFCWYGESEGQYSAAVSFKEIIN